MSLGRGNRNMSRYQRDEPERGSATPLTLLLGLLFIVFPVVVVVLSVPAWEERAVDAQDAARVAVRALATADDWADGIATAQEAVWMVTDGDGVPVNDVEIEFGGSLTPGAEVTAEVTVVMPATSVPFVGQVGSISYTAVSTAHVDSYRAGPT